MHTTTGLTSAAHTALGQTQYGPVAGGQLDRTALSAALQRVARPLTVLADGQIVEGPNIPAGAIAHVPACRPQDLGAPDFGAELPCVAGAMANGIGSTDVVEAMGQHGMIGFYGAAGLMPDRIDQAIEHVSTRLGGRPWGFNLIHSPYEPALEASAVDLYIRRGVRCVSASAYLDLTLPVVRYRLAGIHVDPKGRVVVPNRVLAKISRAEVAEKFLAPAPPHMVRALVEAGELTRSQAQLAAHIPMADDLTVEADSGGHTDNRPALTLLPSMLTLRDRLVTHHGYEKPVRVGAAGGISTPHAAAAAFAMGADYIVTGSVNQGCVEAGTSTAVREMLADASETDVTMAPAADMFEMGVELQVLKRGTMFAMRAKKLYELYVAHPGLDAIPSEERSTIETSIFRAPLEQIWNDTVEFWNARDPAQIERARRDPKHQMALVFRWYLGRSSRWAITGDVERRADYQVWCGPSMGAFNAWVKGSFLADYKNRRVATVARNILYGAAVLTRAQTLRAQGITVSVDVSPCELAKLEDYLR